jgi:hypothetical protein
MDECKIAGPEIDKSSDPKTDGIGDVFVPFGFRI